MSGGFSTACVGWPAVGRAVSAGLKRAAGRPASPTVIRPVLSRKPGVPVDDQELPTLFHAIDQIATTTLAEALERAVSQLRTVLTDALRSDARLLSTGIEILGVQVLAVRPESDVERALQTPVREQLQAEADRAVYERRAVAVERERTISENEMASQIELATRGTALADAGRIAAGTTGNARK